MAFNPSRRSVVAGIAGSIIAGRASAGIACDPDLGPNVLVVDPSMSRAAVQAKLAAIFAAMERQFVPGRAGGFSGDI